MCKEAGGEWVCKLGHVWLQGSDTQQQPVGCARWPEARLSYGCRGSAPGSEGRGLLLPVRETGVLARPFMVTQPHLKGPPLAQASAVSFWKS